MKGKIRKLEDRLYTSKEVCAILGVTLRTLYRYIEDGKLEVETRSRAGRYFFTKRNIVNFLYPRYTKRKQELNKPVQTPEGAFMPRHEKRVS